MPPELLSRFVTFDFKPYTREEFLEVAEAVITGQLGMDPDLARSPSGWSCARKTSARPSRWPSSAIPRKRWTGLRVGFRGQGKRRGHAPLIAFKMSSGDVSNFNCAPSSICSLFCEKSLSKLAIYVHPR